MYLSSCDEGGVYGQRFVLKKAENAYLTLKDTSGKQGIFLDLISAYGSCNFGHCNPQINPFKSFNVDLAACFYPEEAELFSEWIVKKLAIREYEVLFQVGGSMGVSAALAIAQNLKKGKIAHVNGSFHGLGLDALAITSVQKDWAFQNTGYADCMKQHVVTVNHGENPELINWSEISCFIFEPIQGANGYVPLNPEWIRQVIATARKHGVVIISDEVQCGYYRHGHLSISKANSYNPDILIFSKTLTNGLFPFSAVLYDKGIRSILKESVYLAHTHQTSAIGSLACWEVAKFIDNNPIDSLTQGVSKVLSRFEVELRKNVLLTDLYVTGPSLSFEVKEVEAREIVKEALANNILIFTGGKYGQRLRIAPPVTIELSELERAMQIILEILKIKESSIENILN